MFAALTGWLVSLVMGIVGVVIVISTGVFLAGVVVGYVWGVMLLIESVSKLVGKRKSNKHRKGKK